MKTNDKSPLGNPYLPTFEAGYRYLYNSPTVRLPGFHHSGGTIDVIVASTTEVQVELAQPVDSNPNARWVSSRETMSMSQFLQFIAPTLPPLDRREAL